MKSLLDVLKPEKLLPATGALLVALGIALCRALGMQWTLIAVFGLSLVLLLLIGLTVSTLLSQSRKNRFIEGLDKQAEEDYRMASASRRQSLKEFHEKWKQAINSLRGSGLGRHKDPMCALPWYVMIGEPQSGKSTAITNCGLEFPLGESIQGTGGTKNCDWWFSNNFILLDTAGRYTFDEGHEADRDEWIAFLKLIAKYRKRKAINGLIVSIPVDSLMTKGLDQLKLDARKIRQKIDQLSQQLGLHPPVFLLIMKSDLINGFTDFFESLPETRLGEVFGWTNDVRQLQDPIAAFEKSFDELHDTTRKLRLSLMKEETRPEVLKNIYFFSEEFSRLRPRISVFMDVVFKSNPYSPAPFLRGYFFTSGTQVGTVISSLIEALGLQHKLKTFDSSSETRTFFLKEFFSRIILRDQHLSSVSQQRVAMERHKRWFTFAMAGVTFAVFSGMVGVSFFKNLSLCRRVEHTVKASRGEHEGKQALALYNQSATQIGDLVESVERLGERHFGMSWGLYVGDKFEEPLRREFVSTFSKNCLRPTVDRLVEELARWKEDRSGIASIDQFLSDFLLLGKYLSTITYALERRQGISPESIGHKVDSEPEFAPADAQMHPSQGEVRPAEETPRLEKELSAKGAGSAGQVFAQVDFDYIVRRFWEGTLPDSGEVLSRNFSRFVAWQDTWSLQRECDRVRNAVSVDLLRTVFSPESILQYVQSLAYSPIRLSDEYTQQAKIQEEGQKQVEASFSKTVWMEKLVPLLRLLFSFSKDPNVPEGIRVALLNDVLLPFVQTYAQLYQKAWSDFFAQSAVRATRLQRRNQRTVTRWALALGAMEPVGLIGDHTRIEVPQQEGTYLIPFQKALEPFGIIHEFRDREREYTTLLQEVSETWNWIDNNPDESGATEKSRNLLFPVSEQDRVKSPLYKAEKWVEEFFSARAGDSMCQQLRGTLMFPLELARQSLLENYENSIDRNWETIVHQSFEHNLRGRFPFVSDDALVTLANLQDVDAEDFQQFFRRETGTLFSFVEKHLSWVITRTDEEFRLREHTGSRPNLDPAVLEFLNRSYWLSRFFLNDQGDFKQHDLSLETRISNIATRANTPQGDLFVTESRLCIQCDEEGCLTYRDGPPIRKLWKWSIKGCRGVNLSIVVQGKQRPPERNYLEFRGEWSLLKLLRLSRRGGENSLAWAFPIKSATSNQLAGSAHIPYVMSTQKAENPLEIPFGSIRCPKRIFQ